MKSNRSILPGDLYVDVLQVSKAYLSFALSVRSDASAPARVVLSNYVVDVGGYEKYVFAGSTKMIWETESNEKG